MASYYTCIVGAAAISVCGVAVEIVEINETAVEIIETAVEINEIAAEIIETAVVINEIAVEINEIAVEPFSLRLACVEILFWLCIVVEILFSQLCVEILLLLLFLWA